jgi:hypothetical protein
LRYLLSRGLGVRSGHDRLNAVMTRVPIEMISDRSGHGLLEGRGQKAPAPGIMRAREEPVRDVVAQSPATALRVGRGEEVACLVADLAEQGRVRVCVVRYTGGIPLSAPPRARGLKPVLHLRPEMLVGFDDIEESADSYPPLSSVQCGISRFGEDMARTLMAWLSEGQKPAEEARSPVRLVVRGSSSTS